MGLGQGRVLTIGTRSSRLHGVKIVPFSVLCVGIFISTERYLLKGIRLLKKEI